MTKSKLIALYDCFTAKLAKINWLPPLLARLSIGSLFMITGWGKLHDIPKVAAFFTELGIPLPELNARFVACTELFCGTLLVFGLLTRLAAIPLSGTMVVAILTAKMKDIEGITDLLGLDEFIYIVIFIWLIVNGPGLVSVDGYVSRKLKPAPTPAP